MMKKYLLALGLFFVFAGSAYAQTSTKICVDGTNPYNGGNSCIPVSSTSPFPVTVSGGSGATLTANQGTANAGGAASWPVIVEPSAVADAGNAPVSSIALEANHVIKGSAGNLYAFEVTADSTLSAAAWWVMVYNATSAPADGAVTPAKCWGLPAGATNLSVGWGGVPAYFSTGITIGVSTNGCLTKAASAHAFISGEAK